MVDNSWWIGLITGGTAVVASWVTGRSLTRSARVEAEVTANAAEVAQARTRRRDAYRELSATVHGLSEVFWRMEEADAAPEGALRQAVLQEMRTASRAALNEVTRASREVALEGPEDAAEAARQLRRKALTAQRELVGLAEGAGDREAYDRAYRVFREDHSRFLDLARAALEIG